MHSLSLFTLFQVFTGIASVASLSIPRTQASGSSVCVLVAGDETHEPYIIDPFNRPACACECMKEACSYVSGVLR